MNGLLPDASFWRGKRVLLTGHTGFKGTWLALWLHRLGAQVTGLALPPDPAGLADCAGIEQLVTSLHGDIRDLATVQQAFRAADPDVALHLAAQSLVRQSYAHPVETFATNVMGTVHVLQAARSAPRLRALVCVTTDKCYANNGPHAPYRETDPLGGHDPYSASKACAELVTAAWRRSFLSPAAARLTPCAVATARAGNVIGGGDWAPDRLVPDCIRAFSAGQTVRIRSPNATRPWQHVLDPLCGYLLLAEQLWHAGPDFAEAWNFAPEPHDVRPVSEVVFHLARAWGEGAGWRVTDEPQPHEAGFLAIDASLARERLGWRPRLSLPPALDWTVRWYRQHAAGAGARQLIEADIQRYQALGP